MNLDIYAVDFFQNSKRYTMNEGMMNTYSQGIQSTSILRIVFQIQNVLKVHSGVLNAQMDHLYTDLSILK